MDRMADWRTEHSYTLKAGNLLGAPRIIKRKPGQPRWTLFTSLFGIDPCKGISCGWSDCPPCSQFPSSGKKSRKFVCWRRNLTYEAVCLRCKASGIKASYQGESCKSLQRRALAHTRALTSLQYSSFVLKHNLLIHPEEDPLIDC